MSKNAKNKKEEEEVNYSFPYMREQNTQSGWEKFVQFLYDGEEGKVLGRTAKSWAQILFFYLVFYSILTSLFAICMRGMMSTIDMKVPKLQMDQSLIGTNPGVGFRPLSDRTEEGSVIWYDAKNQTQILKWVNLLDEFLGSYYNETETNQVQCDFGIPPPQGKFCAVNHTRWDPCIQAKNYSYPNQSPCVFLKLNKIYGWVPEFYDDPKDLPAEMPQILKEHIAKLEPRERKQVWISCEGEHPIDKELLETDQIEYKPDHGLPEYYFPYVNTHGYLSPLVAVQFKRIPPNRIINIECRAWAKNINYIGGHRDRQGSVHFELMID